MNLISNALVLLGGSVTAVSFFILVAMHRLAAAGNIRRFLRAPNTYLGGNEAKLDLTDPAVKVSALLATGIGALTLGLMLRHIG